jgi:hypothetical protein
VRIRIDEMELWTLLDISVSYPFNWAATTYAIPDLAKGLLATLAWLIAPAGVVVLSIQLWQNIQRLREAHLKIRQLIKELEELERRVQPATTEDMNRETAAYRQRLEEQRRFAVEEQRHFETGSRRRIATSVILIFLAAIPIIGLFSYITNRSTEFAGNLAAQDRNIREMRDSLERLQVAQQQLQELKESVASNAQGVHDELLRNREQIDLLRRTLIELFDLIDRTKLSPEQTQKLDNLKSELNSMDMSR